MQFNQPIFSPYPKNGQYFPFHRNVIGEGEVTPVYFPDGSVHLYFKPTANTPTYSNPWNVDPRNCGWLIKSKANPLSFVQQFQYIDSTSLTRPEYKSDPQIYSPPPSHEYQLKFHNDSASSTTDLHYFYPRIRQSYWFPKPCAEVQVELPPKEALCSKLSKVPIDPDLQCSCKKTSKRTSFTSTSVEDIPKEHQLTTSDETITRKRKKPMRSSKKESKIKYRCNQCKCCSDKAVTACLDKTSGCSKDMERDTQTSSTLHCYQKGKCKKTVLFKTCGKP